MDGNLYKAYQLKALKTVENLNRNNFEAYFVATSQEAVELVKSLCKSGCRTASGGSATLSECGLLPVILGQDYIYTDRAGGPSPDELTAATFTSDAYFMSSNAITEKGELYNIDGTGNRVAALTFGPKNVFVIAGINKIVPDLAAAKQRLEKIASPANAIRLNRKTPCAATGECADCRSTDRICCTTVITSYQRQKGRVKVIIVGEALGY